MKKLMIAAALAAMIGGVEAVPAYQFTATLKTTKAKKGSVTSDAQWPLGVKYRSGGRLATDFWYNDPVATNLMELVGWENKNKDGKDHKEFKTFNGFLKVKTGVNTWGDYVDDQTSYAGPGGFTLMKDALDYLAVTYPDKTQNSAGSWVYCGSYKTKVSAKCYRVAGSAKLQVNFPLPDSCCSTNSNPLAWSDDCLIGGDTLWSAYLGSTITNKFFLQQFGAQSFGSANRFEIYEPVTLPAAANLTTGTDFEGYLAGQGTKGTYQGADVISSISGNIVGSFAAPLCTYCCSTPETAIAFDCSKTPVDDMGYRTAGFGTFRIKFNRNVTKDIPFKD